MRQMKKKVMGFNTEVDIIEWHKIGEKLTSYFGICSCQQKLKSIVYNLLEIKTKCLNQDYNFTGAEWLILVQMEKGYCDHCPLADKNVNVDYNEHVCNLEQVYKD
jgi:hypothetical protein